jgi:hypothetical protein
MVPPLLRRWHSYIGLFIAPSVLFFALTGALQLFDLHEAHGSYRPAALLEKLSAVHKDQVFRQSKHEPEPAPPSANASAAEEHEPEEETSLGTWGLKWLFLMISLGLVVSTSIGIWMGLTQTRNKRLSWTFLLIGIVAPICLLAG